jgi:hypothetical protein
VTGTGIEVLALAALVLGVTIRGLRPQAASHGFFMDFST